MGKKLTKKECRLIAQMWVGSLTANFESHISGTMASDDEQNIILNEVFEISEKLLKEHPKQGNIDEIIKYVKSQRNTP